MRMTGLDVPSLVDPRTGLIRALDRRHAANLPRALCYVQADLGDTRQFCAWPSDPTAAGCVWWDESAAQRAAIGEAAERYCGNLVPAGLRRASYAELIDAGEAAIDPAEVAGYSERQYQQPGFPFVRWTADLPLHWVCGRDVASGERILVPAALVYVTYHESAVTRREARCWGTPYAGVAAGSSRERAIEAAIEELIERDTVTLHWLRGETLTPLVVPSWLRALVNESAEAVEASLYWFTNAFDLPVIGAVVLNRATGHVTLGTAARASATAAALKALAEAFQLHLLLRELDDPQSDLMTLAARTPGHPLKPWDAGRRYRACYRPDWTDATDLLCHMQLYLDPSMHHCVTDRLGTRPRVTLDAVDHEPGATRTRRSHVDRLAQYGDRGGYRAGYRPIAIDLTTPDVASAGLHVVRVVAPGFIQNTPAALPRLGCPRLYKTADSTLAESALYFAPPPYA